MSTHTRRGFLKGLGTTLAAFGVSASTDASAATLAIDTSTAQTMVHGRARMQLRSDQFEMLVIECLCEFVAEQRTFTAYDVTRSLRARYPQVDVAHPAVRAVVHARMDAAIASLHYGRDKVWFGRDGAVRYFPAS